MVLLLRSSEAGCGYFCFQSHSRWKKTPCGLPEISFYLKRPFNRLSHPEDHASLLHTRKHGEVRWAMPRNPCFVDKQARVTGDCASNCGGAWEDCLTMTARMGSALPHSLLVASSKEPEYGLWWRPPTPSGHCEKKTSWEIYKSWLCLSDNQKLRLTKSSLDNMDFYCLTE